MAKRYCHSTFFNQMLIYQKNNNCDLLWQSGIQYDKVLLCLTDSAAYMLAAMASMQYFISENVTFDMFRPWTASCRGIHSFEVQRCQLIDFMHQGCIFESKS